jgi:hypothetical protein
MYAEASGVLRTFTVLRQPMAHVASAFAFRPATGGFTSWAAANEGFQAGFLATIRRRAANGVAVSTLATRFDMAATTVVTGQDRVVPLSALGFHNPAGCSVLDASLANLRKHFDLVATTPCPAVLLHNLSATLAQHGEAAAGRRGDAGTRDEVTADNYNARSASLLSSLDADSRERLKVVLRCDARLYEAAVQRSADLGCTSRE